MVTNALVQARIDSIIKEEATAVLATMGLTVSEAVRLLLTRVAYEQTLPFGLLTPNTETVAAMQEAQRGNLPSVTTMEQFIDAMNAED
jgi:DNA-damage-inducible protein J